MMLHTLLTRSLGARAETQHWPRSLGKGCLLPVPGPAGPISTALEPLLPSPASLKMCFCFELEQGPQGL